MKIAILTANLGNFDNPIDPVAQNLPDGIDYASPFFRFTDENFPPVTGLTPRLQYRIPKMFGYQMMPDYDIYIWLDGSMSLQHPASTKWFLEQLGEADMAFFKHPWRSTIKEEVDHIEEYLQKGNEYIVSRYKNGFHKEQYEYIKSDTDYVDDTLLASTAFIYRNNDRVHEALENWWFYQSRYYTCDQVALPYVLDKVYMENGLKVNIINENIFKNPYISLVSKHK